MSWGPPLILPDPPLNRIPAMTDEAVGKVYELETMVAALPQEAITTDHVLHGGMYARTVMMPKGMVLTGALIKVATLLIFNGHARVYLDGEAQELKGYHVLAASAHRKQAFVTLEDTQLTMIFKTRSKLVAGAEEEFTDEAHLLMSRADGAINNITITGE